MKSLGDALSTPFVMTTWQICGEVLLPHASDCLCLEIAYEVCPEPSDRACSSIWSGATAAVDSPGIPGMSAKISAPPSLAKMLTPRTTTSTDRAKRRTAQDGRIMASLPPLVAGCAE